MEERNKPAVIKVSPERKGRGEIAGPAEPADLVKSLISLSGSEVLRRILDLARAEEAVPAIPHVDFYWLIKKIGPEDSQPLLKLASLDQWQFLLDIETWNRDRLDPKEATNWLGRLFEADPERVLDWLLGEGELFAYWFFSKKMEVQVTERGDPLQDTRFSTLDDIYYFRAFNTEQGDFIYEVLRHLAEKDYLRYQAVMTGLAGTMQDEVEEEIYRLRNVRIAEDGFLPYEEAVSLYAYLDPGSLKRDEGLLPRPEPEEGPPLAPILHVGENNLLLRALAQDPDPLLLDRIRLEFAGLCNQLLSADRVQVSDAEDLVRVCRKGAGYIHAGLERLAGDSPERCRKILEENPLHRIFQVGFSLALEVKWETKRWLKVAWFVRMDLKPAFWGEWGGILVGVLQKRPLFYRGAASHPSYSDFEGAADLRLYRETLGRIKAVDRLLETLSSRHPLEEPRDAGDFRFTFHALLLNFYARQKLNLEPGFAPLSLQEVTNFFRLLRSGKDNPPFAMRAFKKGFVEDMAAHGQEDLEEGARKALVRALSLVWDKFTEEYAWVATADLDGRYLNFILTSPSPGDAPR